MWFNPQRAVAAIEGAARAPSQPPEDESPAVAAPRVAYVAHVARPQPLNLKMTPSADETKADLFEGTGSNLGVLRWHISGRCGNRATERSGTQKRNRQMTKQLGRRVMRLEGRRGAKAEAPTFDFTRVSTRLLERLVEAESDTSSFSEADIAELEAARINPAGGKV